MRRRRTKVDTSDYENAWGKKPRGKGAWCFGLADPKRSKSPGLSGKVFSGFYGAAKMAAISNFGNPPTLYLYS